MLLEKCNFNLKFCVTAGNVLLAVSNGDQEENETMQWTCLVWVRLDEQLFVVAYEGLLSTDL